MTREEAAEILDPEASRNALWKYEGEEQRLEACNEACRIASAALRAQQTPLDRSRREGCHYCDDQETVMELDWIYGLDHILPDYKFCPMCGRPLTEDAWEELERRIFGGQENP